MVIGSGIWGIFCSVINSYRICQTYRAHLSLAIKKHVYSVISMPHFIISNQLYITAFHRCVLNIVVLYWTILYNRLISLPWCLLNKIQTMAISLTISWFGTTTIWALFDNVECAGIYYRTMWLFPSGMTPGKPPPRPQITKKKYP